MAEAIPALGDPGALETSQEYLADRRLCEDFARRVVESSGQHTLAAVFLPWTDGAAPAGVICPASREGGVDAQRFEAMVQGKNSVVIGCTFKYQEERSAAERITEQLLKAQGKCVLAAHLLPPGENHYERSNYENLMQVHQAISRLGVDDVLLDPEWEPARLELRIRLAQHSWSINQERLQSMLAEEPQPPSQEEVEALEATQRQLLWEDIPRELMPHFKPVQQDLQETDNRVGDYSLTEQIETQTGIVWEGKDKQNRKVAIKIILKDTVFTPGEVEGIYREFRFLAGFTRHPNIVRAVDCFHGPKKIYTVMEYVGKTNLGRHLLTLPGKRLSVPEARACFSQIAGAVAHCHSRDVSHRSITLEHITLKIEADGSLFCKLVDFRSAMIAKEGITSVALCGSLPCMAPEVLGGQQYFPKPADCYSVGVILLEMSGGRGSFCQALNFDEQNIRTLPAEPQERADWGQRIQRYFATPGSQKAALAAINGVEDDEIGGLLEGLLMQQEGRSDLAAFENTPPEAELAAAEAAAEAEAAA